MKIPVYVAHNAYLRHRSMDQLLQPMNKVAENSTQSILQRYVLTNGSCQFLTISSLTKGYGI